MSQKTKTATDRNKPLPFLVGYGFDIHNLSKDRKDLILGGVSFPDDPAIAAHSDGDLILHAVANAILGALCLGDIGLYFSDKDTRNKGLDSRKILLFAMEKMRAAGYVVGNADIQLVAEKLMIVPKRTLIVDSLINLMDCQRINVKGTRWEKNSSQVACHVVLTLLNS